MKRPFPILLFIVSSLLLHNCSGCSKSGKRTTTPRSEREVPNKPQIHSNENELKRPVVIQMEKINGVYQIPVLINGVKMHFIFDTGASTITISETEASFLRKQGLLSSTDSLGTGRFSDANGDITEATLINLQSVQIGELVLNDIAAAIMPNQKAPLLLGQSAMEKFGEFSIDYEGSRIILGK